MIFTILDAVRSDYMDTNLPVYEQLNKAWKATCKVLFGEEIGELKEYEEWLLHDYGEKPRTEKSAVSGKETTLICDDYCKDAKFISYDEIDFYKRFEPLNINEIKDIDSIIEALQERFYYTGNTILGNSRYVEGSTNIVDSTYMYNSKMFEKSEYIAYSAYGRRSKFMFGVWAGTDCSHTIKGFIGTKSQRCFEYYMIRFSSDIFYSANVEGCNDCLFCFNLAGKRRCIGNLELLPDNYINLKKKILSEIADELKKKKSVISLLDIVGNLPKEPLSMTVKRQEGELEQFNIAPIQNAFKSTFRVLLKKDPGNLNDYESYLSSKTPRFVILKPGTTASNEEILWMEEYKPIDRIKHRGIAWKEAAALSQNPPTIKIDDAQKLSLNNTSILAKVAFVPFDYVSGKNSNVDKSEICMNSIDCYNGASFVESKSSAFCWWPRESSYMFGSTNIFSSSFCIGAHNSTGLTRAFEVDSCTNCSDIYFSHNCENVQDSMFCFNVKNLRTAIGNAQFPPDKYRSIKDSIIEQMADGLIKKKDLKWNIYNIGCGKK